MKNVFSYLSQSDNVIFLRQVSISRKEKRWEKPSAPTVLSQQELTLKQQQKITVKLHLKCQYSSYCVLKSVSLIVCSEADFLEVLKFSQDFVQFGLNQFLSCVL